MPQEILVRANDFVWLFLVKAAISGVKNFIFFF